jgi:phenylalanyl-tRNA synthetase beta chain
VTETPRYPAVEMDVALVVSETTTADELQTAIAKAGGAMLESARLFDVYRGVGIPQGKKSMAYALTYRADDRTLTAEEVDKSHERLVRKLGSAVGAALRS